MHIGMDVMQQVLLLCQTAMAIATSMEGALKATPQLEVKAKEKEKAKHAKLMTMTMSMRLALPLSFKQDHRKDV